MFKLDVCALHPYKIASVAFKIDYQFFAQNAVKFSTVLYA